MMKIFVFVSACFMVGCTGFSKKSPLIVRAEIPKEMKEISGITAMGSDIWAITDKPKARVFKLDIAGKVEEEVQVTNETAVDVEAVTSDKDNLYLGDVGDNKGDRIERKIIKIAAANIKAGKQASVTGEEIEFTFPGEGTVEKKKDNNFDCESLLSFKDSLYVFTKDREDDETRLYALPKTPGKYVARFINSYNSKGLITDAAINSAGNEVALIGYHKGHHYPFIILFNNFKGNDFFSGDHTKINLASKNWDWQLEGITYAKNDMVYFSCEGTDEVKATFYGIKRQDLPRLKKKKKEEGEDDDESDGPGLTLKGHLKKH